MRPHRRTQWERKTEKNVKFAELLREIRTEAGISQMDLARKLKRPQPYISKLETGRAFITLVEFEEFAFAVGISPAKALDRLYGDR
jgi:transcriptional regulator with XRE-family HTH domain